MPVETPRISVILVAGRQRKRAQHVLDGIGAQDAPGLETVLIDLAPDLPPLVHPPGLDVRLTRGNLPGGFHAARALGVRLARSPIAAFLEEHCRPEAGWAQAVIRAFETGPWAAVGYSFVNANPGTWVSRACMLADYALWEAPHPDTEARLLPGNNVAYRRDTLLAYGDRLGALLSPDFVLHERLRLDGQRLFMAGSAVASHENPEALGFLLTANHAYCRVLAHGRAETGSWSRTRRTFYSLAVPLGAPAIKLVRVARHIARRPGCWLPCLSALPVILPAFLWSSVGEALGCSFGPGSAVGDFEEYELNRART